MKKFLSVTLALLILFNLTSCYRPNTIFRTERSDLYAVTCFSVPYIAGNPEWDKVFIMEQDSQGRTLYKYIANTKFLSDYSDDFVYAMVICQKSDENFASQIASSSWTPSGRKLGLPQPLRLRKQCQGMLQRVLLECSTPDSSSEGC